MSRHRLIRICVILVTVLLGTIPVLSQNPVDAESEYMRIRKTAFDADYVTASADARKLVNMFPSYGDARILLGRILAWQKDYLNAAAVIDTLLLTDPNNEDALSAKSDITLWSKENTAVATDIRAGYFFDSFSQPYSRYWEVIKAGAGHRFKWGQASAGINAGHIVIKNPSEIKASELQFEIDAYPRISNKNYAYVSYAYSPGSYFPQHRATFELWQVLPSGWAASAGLNYYYFDRNIFIAMVSAEKYLGKYWFSLKTFLYLKDEGLTSSFYLNARRYFRNRNYLQLTLGSGTAPDEPFDLQTNLLRLRANSIRLAYNVSVTPKLVMRLAAGYSKEEYADVNWRNRFEGGINLTYALKMK